MVINDHCLLVIAMFIVCVFWEKKYREESTAVNKQDFSLNFIITQDRRQSKPRLTIDERG